MNDFYSQESEVYTLSGMLYREEVLNFCCDVLTPNDFFFTEHRTVFNEFLLFYKDNINPDLEKLITSLKNSNKLDLVGGIAKLTSIVGNYSPVTVDDVEYYVRIIKNNATLRGIQQFASSLTKRLDHSNERHAEDLVGFCQSVTDDLFKQKFGSMAVPITETANLVRSQIMDDYEALRSTGIKPSRTGIPTGYKQLDELIGGLRRSHLIVLSARTGIGKTAFALNLILNSLFQDKSVLMYSLEMRSDELVRRLIANISGISSVSINDLLLDDESLQAIDMAASKICSSKFVCDEYAGLKINELISRAKRYKEKYKTDLIVVDYLQLIRGAKETEARHLEIAEYTRSLKLLAKELDVPVVVLAQLSRRIEDRTGHKIFLSDMRESGSIETDADSVIAISRRDVYDPYDRPNKAQISVLKNRHGPIGEFELDFNPDIGRFG